MITKVCTKCKEEKNVLDFYTDKNTSGYRASCKLCFGQTCKNYREKTKEHIKEYSKDYREKNKELIKEKNKNYRETNKEEIKERQKISSRKYYEKNSELIKNKSRKFREKNPDYSFLYRKNNQSYSNDYQKKRREIDPTFKLIYNFRARLNGFLKKQKIDKTNSTQDLVGCSPTQLKEHLENMFSDGMTWENYGFYGWHIDHIIPLSSAKDEDGLKKLCHYTNLQPLWCKDNLSKGSKIL